MTTRGVLTINALLVALTFGLLPWRTQVCGASGTQMFDKPVHKFTAEEYDRMLDAVPRWVRAAREHQPGVVDPPAREISGLSGFDLEAVLKGIGLVLESEKRRYPFAPPRDELVPIVKRGVLLHADIALIVPVDPSRLPSPLPSSPRQFVIVEFSDARQNAAYHAGIHLEVGRALLDMLRRTKWRDDELASSWYAATSASLLVRAKLGDADPQVTRGVAVLERDPRLLFYAGALHEEYAGARVQRMLEASVMAAGFRSAIRSPRDELQAAERLLTRSLGIDRTASEVRLHRARVFGQLGRHAEAAAELGVVAGEFKDPVLLYYAALFLGDEEAALGHREAARAAFEGAAALFPAAQSPLVALSELAQRHGDRAAAQAALRRLFALPRSEAERDDPWWDYYRSPFENAGLLIAELRHRFLGGTR